jgi:hypothetical protein
MLTITRPRPHHLELQLTGRLTPETMAQALDDFVALAEGIEHGTMLYTLTDFELPELGAFAVELRRLPQLLRLIPRFDRCAVLCDARWVRTIAEVEAWFIPGLEMKGFEPGERAAAEAWLAGAMS